MNLKAIKLNDEKYHRYLDGNEVQCDAANLTTKNLHVGEHVLIYKDTAATNTNLSVPKREMQSEYIGIEGVVTGINSSSDGYEGVSVRKI